MSSSGSGGSGIEARGDIGNSPAATGIAAERVARDVEKRLRNCVRDERVGLASERQSGGVLREGLNQGHAKGPDVGSGRERRRNGFRSFVRIEFAGGFARFTDGEERVAGKLELVGSGENVGRFDARMNEALGMEIDKSVQNGLEHVASFGGFESALGKDLGKVFFGILHDGIEAVAILDAATADVENAKQIGMGELHNAKPQIDLMIGSGSGSDELDYRFFRLRRSELSEENGGVIGTA